MKEQRRSLRVPVKLDLEVSDIFKQDNIKIDDIHAPIEVTDISRDGIGFVSKSVLPVGYYFNARLEINGSANAVNSVVRILRQQKTEDGMYHYGCEFTGMPAVFSYMFDAMEENYKK